ncbi:MAG: hypothetical protein WCO60_12935 [Verrucomicrobiota bacterium]
MFTRTVLIRDLFRGYLVLQYRLLPLSLLVFLFLWIMGGSGAGSPRVTAFSVFWICAGFVYIAPVVVFVCNVLLARMFDSLFCIQPWRTREVSRLGVLLAGAVLVILGNVFVDNLYQFKKGNYGLSVWALGLDLAGMALVYRLRNEPLPLFDRFRGDRP